VESSVVNELISKTAAFKAAYEVLNKYIEDLLEKKRELENSIEKIESQADPLKQEVAEIEGEIKRIMNDAKIDSVKSESYSVSINNKFSASILDKAKFLKFAEKYPSILLADIVKKSELEKLVNEGIVPNPERDGVSVDSSFRVFKFIKKSKN
jgi:hypothetical protein